MTDRITRLEQQGEVNEADDEVLCVFPERESAIGMAPGRRVYHPIQTFTDERGKKYHGIMNGEGVIERLPPSLPEKSGRAKFTTSGSH